MPASPDRREPGPPHQLLGWLDAPRAGRGVRLAQDDGTWTRTSYVELAGRVRRVATVLRDHGVRDGDTVAVTMPTSAELIAAIFGTWQAGAVLTVVAPRSFESEQECLARVTPVMAAAGPALVLCGPGERALTEKAAPGVTVLEFGPRHHTADDHGADDHGADDHGADDHGADDHGADDHGAGSAAREPSGLALLQFTSGSTSTPRGVRVTWGNLADNLERIGTAIGWRDGNAAASWLPIHHDMGFIGGLLFPVSAQSDLWLLRPDQFITDPARWLECFDSGRATHGAAPSFALGYAARKVKPERLAGLDLSGWRSVIVGAERVDAAALARFAALTSPAGFSGRAFQPAYGLAENTLIVCASPLGEPVRLARPDWSRTAFGEPVQVTETMEFAPVGPDAGRLVGQERLAGQGWLAGHGWADGVRILDDDGAPLPDGWLGEIAVSGASVTTGYHGLSSRTHRSGELRTADAGFVLGGHLYVLGRMGDSIKVSGRSVFMEDLDARVAMASGLSPGRLCVVGATRGPRPGIAVFAEADPGPWKDAVLRFLRAELGASLDIQIITGERGLLKRTTSGKPRRRHMWQALNEMP
jgi:fatty-acyl-CoA synthase